MFKSKTLSAEMPWHQASAHVYVTSQKWFKVKVKESRDQYKTKSPEGNKNITLQDTVIAWNFMSTT